MTAVLVFVIVVAVLWFVWRFVTALWSPHQQGEPMGPDSFVPATRKGGPRGRGAAVALDEPDDEDMQSFPPRYQ
jgi:hypothetical protein